MTDDLRDLITDDLISLYEEYKEHDASAMKGELPEYYQHILPLQAALSKESERGKVLLLAGYIHEELKKLLQAFLIPSKVSKSLFADQKALDSFSNVTDLTFSLGLISAQSHKDIAIIRRVRNTFAHELDAAFSREDVINRCMGLSTNHDKSRSDIPIKFFVCAQLEALILTVKAHEARMSKGPPFKLEMVKWRVVPAFKKLLEVQILRPYIERHLHGKPDDKD